MRSRDTIGLFALLLTCSACGCFCSGNASSAGNHIDDKEFLGKIVGALLDHHGVGFSDLSMIDEPPGKLRCISFERASGNDKQRIYVVLDYTAKLFSAKRKWSPDSVRGATITRITTDPPDLLPQGRDIILKQRDSDLR